MSPVTCQLVKSVIRIENYVPIESCSAHRFFLRGTTRNKLRFSDPCLERKDLTIEIHKPNSLFCIQSNISFEHNYLCLLDNRTSEPPPQLHDFLTRCESIKGHPKSNCILDFRDKIREQHPSCVMG